MSENVKELISEKIQEAVKDVFTKNLSMPIELVPTNTISENSRTLLSSIQFDGTLKGTIAIMSREFCATAIAMKMLGDDISEDMINTSDTIGEVLNMVLGGLKNKLEKTPYTFNLGTPKVLEKKTILDEKDVVTIEENFISDDIKFKIEMVCHVVEAKPKEEVKTEIPKPAAALNAVDLLMQALAKNTKPQAAAPVLFPASTSTPAPVPPTEKKILIVHDDLFEHELIKTSLKQSNSFKVDVAKSTQEALDKIKSMKPNTILLGLNFANVSGINAIKEVEKLIDEKTNIIVLTLPYNALAKKIVPERNAIRFYDYLSGYNRLLEKIQELK